MIPEQYWLLVRKWFWLIGGFAIAGGVAGVLLLPSVVGSTDGFNSSATLAVSQQASLASVPTSGDVEVDDTVVASYTESLVTYAASPQFIDAVQAAPLLEGLGLTTSALEGMLEVTANPTLFRVTIEVTADSEVEATAVAAAAVDELKRRAIEEETQLASALVANLDRRAADLAARLPGLEAAKLVGTVDARRLALIEASVVNAELEEIFTQRENLRLGQTFSLPLVTVKAPQTVAVDGRSLSSRDLALLGLVGGLLAGWGAANIADGLTTRPKRSLARRTDMPPVVVSNGEAVWANGWTDVQEAHEVGVHLGRLAERAVQLDRRVRALDSFRASTNGVHEDVREPQYD